MSLPEGLPLKYFFLVAPLHDVSEDENADHKVEGGFRHGCNGIAGEVQVGQMSSLGQEHYPHDEKNEETENFIHSIFLEEGGDPV